MLLFSCRNKDIWIFGWVFQFLRMVMNIFTLISFGIHTHINIFFLKDYWFNFCSFKICSLLYSINQNLCIYFFKETWIYFILIIFYLKLLLWWFSILYFIRSLGLFSNMCIKFIAFYLNEKMLKNNVACSSKLYSIIIIFLFLAFCLPSVSHRSTVTYRYSFI